VRPGNDIMYVRGRHCYRQQAEEEVGPKEDEKTLEDDAAEEEFIRTNPAMSNRAMARTLRED
jgi:hypothetical protein